MNQYQAKRILGHGVFGTVYKVFHEPTRQMRAMKIIKQNNVKHKQKIQKEIEILKNVDHPNILKVYEHFSDEHNIYICTELCLRGDLHKYR